MVFTCKIKKYENSENYYSFTFINLVFINTYQVWSINFTFCNLFLKILKEKINKHEAI